MGEREREIHLTRQTIKNNALNSVPHSQLTLTIARHDTEVAAQACQSN